MAPLSFDERRYTTRVTDAGSSPSKQWYNAIGERPIEDILGHDGCYAVVRVELGYNEEHASGQYLIVTMLFKTPQMEVTSKSLKLPGDDSGRLIWRFWAGHAEGEDGELTKAIRGLLVVERRIFMPGEGEPRSCFTRTLNRYGIGTLPSVRSTADHGPIPVHSFVRVTMPDGTTKWRATLSGGGRSGGVALWQFASCWREGDREGFHEFSVDNPFGINDVRYERLLLEIAKHSGILKEFLEDTYDSIAANRVERSKWTASTASGKQEYKGKSVPERAADTRHAADESQTEATAGLRAVTQQHQLGTGQVWAPAAAFVAGLVMGALGAWLFCRRRDGNKG